MRKRSGIFLIRNSLPFQHVYHLPGNSGRRIDNPHFRTRNTADGRHQERIVGASQNDDIGPCIQQRPQTAFYHRLGLIYVPKDAGPETKCLIFYPGGYDEALANNYLTEYVYAPDPPNAIMLLCYANGYGHVADKVEDSYRALEQAAIENNVFLHDLVLCGASMGAYTACQGAAILWENHGLAAKTVMTFDAGMHWEVESHVMSPEQCDSTAKAGTRFYLFEFGGVGMNKRAIELMVAHGNDVTIVECAGGGHYGIITDAIEYGMIDWALGRGERPVNSNYKYYPLDRSSTYPYGVG